MKGRIKFGLVGSMALFMFLFSLTIVQLSMAETIDQFDVPTLNEDLWEMKLEGDATFEINDGVLTMTSPGVDSGAILYYAEDVESVDISFEVELDTSGVVDNITIGFIADIMEPQVNTDINNQWEASFFFLPGNWYLKQDPVTIGTKPPNPGIEGPYDPGVNTVKIDCSESKGKITFYLNGKEVGEVDKNPDVKSRYFHITCDPYTTHYSGEVAIESIKFDGTGAPSLVVQPVDKLTTTWGNIKYF